MKRKLKFGKKIKSAILAMTLALTVICGTFSTVYAAGDFDSQVYTIYGNNYSEAKYTVDSKYNSTDVTQGYLTGASLVKDDGMVNETNFKKLTNQSQRQLIKDLNDSAESVLRTDSVNEDGSNYTDEDYQNWVEKLQQCDGVGSRLISTLMANTKPDFASANRIYQPFSGTVGTVLGLVAVLLMAALAIVMVLDLAYIAIPFVRNLLDGGSSDGGNGSSGIKSKFVSWEAYNAVQQVEAGGGNSGNGGGDNKTAVGIYFKKRIIMLLILGLCLLYLVQGEIFTMVGWFMDLVSGLLPTT